MVPLRTQPMSVIPLAGHFDPLGCGGGMGGEKGDPQVPDFPDHLGGETARGEEDFSRAVHLPEKEMPADHVDGVVPAHVLAGKKRPLSSARDEP